MDNTPGCAIYAFTYRYLTLPLRISSICRLVHKALTGPHVRLAEMVKEDLLHKAWSSLDRCWQDLGDLRQVGTGDIIEVEDMERFIHGWQVSYQVKEQTAAVLILTPIPADFYI